MYICKYCKKETKNSDSKCDNCWEIETRITGNLKVAKKIYKAVKKKK
jgi:hypothetical protein